MDYEDLLEAIQAGEVKLIEKDKTWGNKAEGVMYIQVSYIEED